jgi:hypothetical protein
MGSGFDARARFIARFPGLTSHFPLSGFERVMKISAAIGAGLMDRRVTVILKASNVIVSVRPSYCFRRPPGWADNFGFLSTVGTFYRDFIRGRRPAC